MKRLAYNNSRKVFGKKLRKEVTSKEPSSYEAMVERGRTVYAKKKAELEKKKEKG